MVIWASMSCHIPPQYRATLQAGPQTQQRICQTMCMALTSCGLWSQSSQASVQQGLLQQATSTAEDPMQVRMIVMLHSKC